MSPLSPFSSESLFIWDARRADLPLGPLCTVEDVDPMWVRGRAPPAHWRRPLSGGAWCAGLVHPRAAPPPSPPHAWVWVCVCVCVCVSYSGGASCEWSPPPANAAAASRGLRESRAGGDSGCGLVFTVIVASPCLGGLCSGLLLPRECASTVITRSLPGLPTHPELVRVESDPRTRVFLDIYGTERPRGRGHGGRFDVSFRPGGPGADRRGPRRRRGQPRLPAAVAAVVTV